MIRVIRAVRNTSCALLTGAGVVFSTTAHAETVAVGPATVHIGDGTIMDDAVVLVSGDKIVGVVPAAEAPSDAERVGPAEGEEDWVITPGLIDANAKLERLDAFAVAREAQLSLVTRMVREMHDPRHLMCTCAGQALCAFASRHDSFAAQDAVCPLCGAPGPAPAEQFAPGLVSVQTPVESSSEVVPHTRVLDSVNLLSPDFDRLISGGVTTVFAAPDPSAVIGPTGAIIRTGGSLRDRVIQAEAGPTAVVGSGPYAYGPNNFDPIQGFVNNRTRRPGTRMGVIWVLRKALNDAGILASGGTPSGADTAPEPALRVLWDLLDSGTPIRLTAETGFDIESGLNAFAEFDAKPVVVGAAEAFQVIDSIVASEAPVVFGPIEVDPTGLRASAAMGFGGFGGMERRLDTFNTLLENGITTALSAQDLREENGLARQAMYAVRNGAEPADAIRAVTLTPAELLGIDDETGSITAGKRADLVLWSGDPLSGPARAEVVWIGGEPTLDRR
ncbi:MAG: amidohydrolase family protein [Planctomycetota bacterium]